MNTCRTCRFWIEHSEAPTHHFHHICLNPKIVNGDTEADGLDACANHIYGISTGPDFGCVHHTDGTDADRETIIADELAKPR